MADVEPMVRGGVVNPLNLTDGTPILMSPFIPVGTYVKLRDRLLVHPVVYEELLDLSFLQVRFPSWLAYYDTEE